MEAHFKRWVGKPGGPWSATATYTAYTVLYLGKAQQVGRPSEVLRPGASLPPSRSAVAAATAGFGLGLAVLLASMARRGR